MHGIKTWWSNISFSIVSHVQQLLQSRFSFLCVNSYFYDLSTFHYVKNFQSRHSLFVSFCFDLIVQFIFLSLCSNIIFISTARMESAFQQFNKRVVQMKLAFMYGSCFTCGTFWFLIFIRLDHCRSMVLEKNLFYVRWRV